MPIHIRVRQILAEEAVGEIQTRPRGLLSVNAPVSFGQIVLPAIISGFLQRYPDVSLSLSLNDNYVDVVQGRYDVVIRIGDLKDSSLIAKLISQQELLKKFDETRSVLEARVEKMVKAFLKKADVVTGDELKALKKEIRDLKKAVSKEKDADA